MTYLDYAVIEIGGHQILIEKNRYFITNKIYANLGTNLLINRTLLLQQEGKTYIGKPYLENMFIKCNVIEHVLGSKITVFKMKAKKGYRRKKGHRQKMTKLFVDLIKVKS